MKISSKLLQEVWGNAAKPVSNVVAKTIERVRDNVDTGFDPRLIQNVPGKGYKVKAESHTATESG